MAGRRSGGCIAAARRGAMVGWRSEQGAGRREGGLGYILVFRVQAKCVMTKKSKFDSRIRRVHTIQRSCICLMRDFYSICQRKQRSTTHFFWPLYLTRLFYRLLFRFTN